MNFLNNINKKKLKKYDVFILFSAAFFCYLFYIFYGYETTDTGFHLSKQWSLFSKNESAVFDRTAGTNIIGGLWLALFGRPFLLWARLGFVILQSLTAVFTFKLLKMFFRPSKVLLTVLFVVITTSYFQYYHTVNYDNLPYLLLLISVYYAIKGSYQENRNSVFAVSGVFAFAAFFCKITMISAFIIPALIIIITNKRRNIIIDRTKYFFYGAGICFAAVWFFMFLAGGLNEYLSKISSTAVDFIYSDNSGAKYFALRDHSYSVLISRYFKDLVFILRHSLLSVIYIIAAAYLLNKKFKYIRSGYYFKSFLLIIFAGLVYFRIFAPDGQSSNLYRGIISYYTSFAVLYFIFFRKKPGYNAVLFLTAALVFTAAFFGSDLGISTGMRSGAGIFYISLASLMLSGAIQPKKFNFRPIVYVSLFLFLIFMISKDYRPYRDYKFSDLDKNFSSPQLLGIKSNPVRVKVTDSLLMFLNSVEELENKKVFYSKGNAIFYYLTNTSYPLNSPWDLTNKFDELKKDLTKDPPGIFVNAKYTHRDPLWPYVDGEWYQNDLYELRAKRYYKMYEDIVNDSNYVKIFENEFYNVYEFKN